MKRWLPDAGLAFAHQVCRWFVSREASSTATLLAFAKFAGMGRSTQQPQQLAARTREWTLLSRLSRLSMTVIEMRRMAALITNIEKREGVATITDIEIFDLQAFDVTTRMPIVCSSSPEHGRPGCEDPKPKTEGGSQ